jgi:sugar phosphate isomerase/epimerase
MKLSLSVRIAEDYAVKDRTHMSFSDLAQMARAIGYDAICMRASQASVSTPLVQIEAMRSTLDVLGLQVSMVTGNVALAANNAEAPEVLRHITRHLDLAESFDAPMVRIMMQTAADIPLAQRAAAEAQARGKKLAHQLHVGTLFQTVQGAMETMQEVNHPALGITYEPANLLAVGEPYGPEVIARLAPYIINVYIQNLCRDPDGHVHLRCLRGEIVRVRSLPLDASGGVDLDAMFTGLRAIGYEGYITVHQSALPRLPIEAAAQRYYDILAAYIQRPEAQNQ